jgi:hypothetical protein
MSYKFSMKGGGIKSNYPKRGEIQWQQLNYKTSHLCGNAV